jgi:hypothetical protein
MAEQKSGGLFAMMNKNARLRKNMQKAKTMQAAREFSGPDGDYECTLSRYTPYEKDGITCAIFEFRTTEEAGEFANEKIIIFFALKDDGRGSATDKQEELLQMVQIMGIKTAELSEQEIEDAIIAFTTSETLFTVRMKTSKPNRDKRVFKNPSIVGVAAEGQKDPDYSPAGAPDDAPAEDEWPEADESPIAAEETAEDEWGDEEAAEEFKPSDAIGQECLFKGKKCILVNANNETGKCIIEDPKTKKRLTSIDWDKLEWPEA